MAYLAGKSIAISGAGIGGLTFALALDKACKAHGFQPLPSITVFERDASATGRDAVGYSFSLMQTGQGSGAYGGLKVVRDLQQGILEELARLQEPGNDMHICSQTLQPIIKISSKRDETGATSEGLRIMRGNLRNTLLKRIPPGRIQYGKTCVSAVSAPREGQPVLLKFADGSMVQCDLLIVADGANSRLRTAMLPQEQNRYAGLCMLFGRTHELKLPPELAQGHYLVLGKHHSAMFFGSVNQNTIMWSLSSPAPQSAADDLNGLFKNRHEAYQAQAFLDQEVPRRIAAAGCGGELLRSVVDQTDVSSLLALPAMDKLPHSAHGYGVAYVGDAWHTSNPFTGAGANQALLDGWELAHELVNGGHGSAQAAIDRFTSKAADRSIASIKSGQRIIGIVSSSGVRRWLFVSGFRILGFILGLLKGQSYLMHLIKTTIWPNLRDKAV